MDAAGHHHPAIEDGNRGLAGLAFPRTAVAAAVLALALAAAARAGEPAPVDREADAARGVRPDVPSRAARPPDGEDECEGDEKDGGDEEGEDDEIDLDDLLDDDEEDGGDEGTVVDDPDLRYVLDHLEERFAPTSLDVGKDGRVTLLFDFGKKKETHEDIFTKRIGDRMENPFRWTVLDEEIVIGGEPGVRVSNQGAAFLDLWFEDDVEAEITYKQYVNHAARHVVAVVYGGPRLCMGSNYGCQTAWFVRGRKARPHGKVRGVRFNRTAKIGLAVKDGTFEARRGKAKESEQSYEAHEKKLSSGRIGILWAGSLSGIIPTLEVSGKLDAKRSAKAIRKALERRR